MPSWVEGAAGTFAISALSAWVFVVLSCRGIGRPFGPRARWWALTVVLITAIVATGLGVAAVAVSDHLHAVYIGVVVPIVLWLGRSANPGRSQRGFAFLRILAVQVAFPLRRLDGSMGDDMQYWCDVRSAAVVKSPELIYDAAQHYYLQVTNRIKDRQRHRELDDQLDSIRHKVAIARRAKPGGNPASEWRDELGDHQSTRGSRKYSAADPALLARRMESDAQNELHLMLAGIYRLGYTKLVTYRGYKPAPPGWLMT